MICGNEAAGKLLTMTGTGNEASSVLMIGGNEAPGTFWAMTCTGH